MGSYWFARNAPMRMGEVWLEDIRFFLHHCYRTDWETLVAWWRGEP